MSRLNYTVEAGLKYSDQFVLGVGGGRLPSTCFHISKHMLSETSLYLEWEEDDWPAICQKKLWSRFWRRHHSEVSGRFRVLGCRRRSNNRQYSPHWGSPQWFCQGLGMFYMMIPGITPLQHTSRSSHLCKVWSSHLCNTLPVVLLFVLVSSPIFADPLLLEKQGRVDGLEYAPRPNESSRWPSFVHRHLYLSATTHSAYFGALHAPVISHGRHELCIIPHTSGVTCYISHPMKHFPVRTLIQVWIPSQWSPA